ncbi:MAG: biosynthetic-type acetolactate synthase large subunit [Muribaculaceae bacterium]|nr:biosynthetic-type acetolactate synthase large subunit [Muribaculaceae bacterium]
MQEDINKTKEEKITGGEALIRCLKAEGADIVFGYPGGTIMPVYDNLYAHREEIRHILTRHEQGAIHAAEGFARATGKTGVVVCTSGPGATNLVTGIADARIDSTPLVVIAGQVSTTVLGNDAFQETDFIDVTNPISKWGILVKHASEIPDIIARAFFIANSGRPGPVVIDLPRNVQLELMDWKGYEKCDFIRTYIDRPKLKTEEIRIAAGLLNEARRPLILAGNGVSVARAERLLGEVAEKGDFPVATTMLGLSAMPSGHRLNKGMLGMHGNIGPNVATNRADVILAVGIRFDDRVVGSVKDYAPLAKIIHIDIDASEMGRTINPYLTIHADAADALKELLPLIEEKNRPEWLEFFSRCEKTEYEKVIKKQIAPPQGSLMTMAEVVNKVSEAFNADAILVTDVGQNQMTAVRYFRFSSPHSVITSGGLGTMGFGLPASIGAKIGCPQREVCLFCGDGGFQMTMQELGTIMEEGVAVKIVILNNNFLGNVRQWQQLFFGARYSQTPLLNPDFQKIAAAYGIKGEDVEKREELDEAIKRLKDSATPYLLNINIDPYDMVFPMIYPGEAIDNIKLNETETLDVLQL